MVGSDCLEVGIVEEVVELEENNNVIKLDQITAGPSVSSDHFVLQSEIASDQDTLKKCILCMKNTDEKPAIISRGLDALIEHCKCIGDTSLMNYLKNNIELQHMVHGTCRRKLAYKAHKNKLFCDAGAASNEIHRSTRSAKGSFAVKQFRVAKM